MMHEEFLIFKFTCTKYIILVHVLEKQNVAFDVVNPVSFRL